MNIAVKATVDQGQYAGRIDSIDALRGLAILAVVFVHVAYGFPVLGRSFILLSSLGRYAVDLFFVISGWILCHACHGVQCAVKVPVGVAMLGRWVRLFPVYAIGIFCYGLVFPRLGYGVELNAEGGWLNALILNAWDPLHASSVVPGGWSISVEAWAGMGLITLLPVLSSLSRSLCAWLICLIGIHVTAPSLAWLLGQMHGENLLWNGIFETPWMNFPTFIGGAVCWHYYQRNRLIDHGQRRRWVRSALFAAGMALIISLHADVAGEVSRPMQAGVGTVFLVMALAGYVWSRGLIFMGRICYGIYLSHFFCY